jgi:hypothetical protein
MIINYVTYTSSLVQNFIQPICIPDFVSHALIYSWGAKSAYMQNLHPGVNLTMWTQLHIMQKMCKLYTGCKFAPNHSRCKFCICVNLLLVYFSACERGFSIIERTRHVFCRWFGGGRERIIFMNRGTQFLTIWHTIKCIRK